MTSWDAIYESPLGLLGVRMDDSGRLAEIDYLFQQSYPAFARPVARPVISALDQYFRQPKYPSRVVMAPTGTPFQQRVWHALCRIPAGEVRTYAELAESLASAPRAVGQACRRNPIPILIPCHRVVAKAGAGGYAGQTGGELLAVKRWLLNHETQSHRA